MRLSKYEINTNCNWRKICLMIEKAIIEKDKVNKILKEKMNIP